MAKPDREWWVKVNIDDLCDSLDRLETTEERGLWLEGFRVGSRGHDKREEWTFPKILGHEFGSHCHDEAVIFRDKKVIAGQISADTRRERNGTAQPPQKTRHTEHAPNGVRAVLEQTAEHSTEQALEQAPNQPTTNNQQPTAISQKRSTRNESPLDPPRGKRFVPPTESEWVAYCGETWADWHQECAADAWAYYESKGWKIGSATCKDWKAAARTAHGNARAWGKLQPMGKQPISPPAPRQEAKRPSWAIDRDLNDARKELQRQQEARKEARDQRNRFSVGQEEYRKYSGQMADADARIREAEERITELTRERGGGNG